MASTLPSPRSVTVEDRIAALEAQLGALYDQFRDYLASREVPGRRLTLIQGGRR